MKRTVILMFVSVLISCFIIGAQELKKASPPGSSSASLMGENEFLEGIIVDNNSVTKHKKNLAAFVANQSKEKAAADECVECGYSLYLAGGQLAVFDDGSSKAISNFLKKPKSRLQVKITAKKKNGKYFLIDIKNLPYKKAK